MALFTLLSQITQYVSISSASATTGILPKMRRAEEDYIIPVLGQTLYDSLQAEVTSGTVTHTDLLDKVRAALAFLIYYTELPFLHTVITDSGLRSVTNDKVQGAYRYQYEDVRSNLEDAGLSGLEKLYAFLMANAADYPTWQNSTAYQRLNKNIIRTGADFSNYYFLFQPNRTFHALQPVLQESEDFYIKNAIGEDYFNLLKSNASPTTAEAKVIDLLKKAVANLTIHKAITKLSVKVRPEGFTVILGGRETAFSSSNNEQSATDKQLEKLFNETYHDGNAYLVGAQKYLNDNASVSVFADYFTSPNYIDPTAVIVDPNDINGGMYAF